MKKTAFILAVLMVGGSAIAQSTYDTTTDTDVSAQESMTTQDSSTTDATVGTTADTNITTDSDMSAHTGMTHTDTTATTTSTTGVGGPYQPTTARAMNAPSSKGGYPPCDPGPGDDNCIQLYEAGVSTSTNLAMNRNLGDESTMMASADTSTTWTNEVGTTASTTGTGGPYEPVTGSADPYQPPVVREQGATEATDVAGTDYPACDPGPGDDNCIQLYERGVSGDIE